MSLRDGISTKASHIAGNRFLPMSLDSPVTNVVPPPQQTHALTEDLQQIAMLQAADARNARMTRKL